MESVASMEEEMKAGDITTTSPPSLSSSPPSSSSPSPSSSNTKDARGASSFLLRLLSKGRKSSSRGHENNVDGVAMLPCEKHEFTTPDGWRLSFKHYKAPATVQRKHTTPVMLVHGLTSNHRVFDMRGYKSLAWSVCQAGYDAWLFDLRGSGLSEKPKNGRRTEGWGFKAHTQDIRLAIDYVLAHHGVKELHYIGHSMGGMLGLMVLGAFTADYGSKIKSMTTITSTLYLEDSWWKYHRGVLLLPKSRIDFVPSDTLMRAYAPVCIYPEALVHVTNVERPVLQAALRTTVEKLSTKVYHDFSRGFRREGFVLDLGNGPQSMPELLKHVQHPVLMIAADYDQQCTAHTIWRTTQMIGSPRKRYVLAGPKPHYQHHYGHLDILIGRHAHREVFPHVTTFLHEYEHQQKGQQGHDDGSTTTTTAAALPT